MSVELKPRIVVVGVGGAGGNAVNNMIEAQLQGVEFVVANTDAQALERSKAPTHIQLGTSRTAGLGAGANPEVGAEAAKESADEIKELLSGAHMCFIAAGMGGGTGTGAAPIIARIAKEQNVLTVGVVTKPFEFEGKRRMTVAEKGIEELRDEVDTLIIIPNQNLFRIASKETTFAEAFHLADQVLYSGVRGITDLMVMPGLINLDFADVNTIMADMGTAMMGNGEASGENRAVEAAKIAIANPLLDDVSMKGAKGVIINITGGYDMTLFEVDAAANEIRREVESEANIILGSTFDQNMEGSLRVSVVAAGVTRLDLPTDSEKQFFDKNESSSTPPVSAAVPTPEAHSGVFETQEPTPSETVDTTVSEAYEPVAEASEPAPAPEREGPVIHTRPTPDYAEPETEPQRTTTVSDEVATETPVNDTGFEAPEAREDAFEDTGDSIAAEAVTDAAADGSDEGNGRSLKKLFGWGNKSGEETTTEIAPASSSDDEDTLEDELEIPAFLRRSANN